MAGSKPDFKALMEAGGGLKGFAWPEVCGDFSMRIAKDGTWFYQGSPIGRIKLCKLFATVLQRDEAGDYWLVTPMERGKILVEDAPFIAVEMKVTAKNLDDQEIFLRSNLDHWVRIDQDHPLRIEIDPISQEPAPYVMMWDGLEAKLNRPTFYHLVDLALENDQMNEDGLGFRSAGMRFTLGSVT